jgi:hypothetical protein
MYTAHTILGDGCTYSHTSCWALFAPSPGPAQRHRQQQDRRINTAKKKNALAEVGEFIKVSNGYALGDDIAALH